MQAKDRPRGSRQGNVYVLADLDATLVLECTFCQGVQTVGSYRSAADFRKALNAFARDHENRACARPSIERATAAKMNR